MRTARTLVLTIGLALGPVALMVAALSASSGAFGFHAWPTAPDSAPRAKVVQIDAPAAAAPEPRTDVRTERRPAEVESGELLAAAPDTAPVTRRPQAPESGGRDQRAPAVTDGAPVTDPAAHPEPVEAAEPLPTDPPAPAAEFPAKELTDAPAALTDLLALGSDERGHARRRWTTSSATVGNRPHRA